MSTKPLLAPVLFFLLFSCTQSEKKETKENNTPAGAAGFIRAPVKEADIPYAEYTVEAGKDDTLFYKTGSFIVLPPNAFTDKAGNIIQGPVQVKYREFTDPIDFYCSGIPMEYDSAGTRYTFESSGMCEILAFKDDQPVFVNPKSRPQINMVSSNDDPTHNLYFLDTVKKTWINKGKSTITRVGSPKASRAATPDAEIPEAPVKPGMANNQSPVITIAIDSSSFKELKAYDNLKFQLDPGEKSFDPKDADVEWNNVELLKGTTKGTYTVRFSKPGKSVSYKATPVLEGKDYDKALEVFEKKNAAYQQKINAQKEKLVLTGEVNTRLLRSFEVDDFGLGIWNCDAAITADIIPLAATFTGNSGAVLQLENIAVIHRSRNSIFRAIENRIAIAKGDDNMIIGTFNGLLAYIPYAEVKKLDINAGTKERSFTMNIIANNKNSYELMKRIAKE